MRLLVGIIMGYLDDYMAGRLCGGLHELSANEAEDECFFSFFFLYTTARFILEVIFKYIFIDSFN